MKQLRHVWQTHSHNHVNSYLRSAPARRQDYWYEFLVVQIPSIFICLIVFTITGFCSNSVSTQLNITAALQVQRRTEWGYFPSTQLLSIYGSTAFSLDLGRLLIYIQLVGHLGWGISQSQGRHLHTEQHKHRINAKTSMPLVGFEPTTPVFQRGKRVLMP
jgi:hypothetical protein